MAMSLWKATERAFGKLFYAKRVGPSGKETPDLINGWLAVEVKEREVLAGYLKDWMAQAERNAQNMGNGRLPILALHEKGNNYRDDLVIMRAGEFSDRYCSPEDLLDGHEDE
jgi:hypothetical protein